MVCLPEHFTGVIHSKSQQPPKPAEEFLRDLARSLKIILVGGTIDRLSGSNWYNTCILVNTHGNISAYSTKEHLFGSEASRNIQKGKPTTVTEIESFRFLPVLMENIQKHRKSRRQHSD